MLNINNVRVRPNKRSPEDPPLICNTLLLRGHELVISDEYHNMYKKQKFPHALPA